MKQERLTKGQKADIMLHETQWTCEEWKEFCKANDCGLIIEDGKIRGFVTEPVEYRL